MKILNYEQGTPEWLASRAGKVTASMVSNVMAAPSTAAYQNYRAQIVSEILTGKPQSEIFVTKDMEFGSEQEKYARALYEIRHDVMVEQVGLVLHPYLENCAASPDGIVGEGLIEIKVPKVNNHVGYILDDKPPTKYHNQMTWQLACTGQQWVDFVSFRPDLPENLQLFVSRFQRDDKAIAAMEDAVKKFFNDVDLVITKLKGKNGHSN
jgi:putative phage-type endonuclease